MAPEMSLEGAVPDPDAPLECRLHPSADGDIFTMQLSRFQEPFSFSSTAAGRHQRTRVVQIVPHKDGRTLYIGTGSKYSTGAIIALLFPHKNNLHFEHIGAVPVPFSVEHIYGNQTGVCVAYGPGSDSTGYVFQTNLRAKGNIGGDVIKTHEQPIEDVRKMQRALLYQPISESHDGSQFLSHFDEDGNLRVRKHTKSSTMAEALLEAAYEHIGHDRLRGRLHIAWDNMFEGSDLVHELKLCSAISQVFRPESSVPWQFWRYGEHVRPIQSMMWSWSADTRAALREYLGAQ